MAAHLVLSMLLMTTLSYEDRCWLTWCQWLKMKMRYRGSQRRQKSRVEPEMAGH